MAELGGIFFVLYFLFIIALSLYVLVLLSRFVGAHQRIATALERAASHLHRLDRQPPGPAQQD